MKSKTIDWTIPKFQERNRERERKRVKKSKPTFFKFINCIADSSISIYFNIEDVKIRMMFLVHDKL